MTNTSRLPARPVFWALLIVGVVLIATAVVMVHANRPAPTDAGALTPSASTSSSATSSVGRPAVTASGVAQPTQTPPSPPSSTATAHSTSSSSSVNVSSTARRPPPAPSARQPAVASRTTEEPQLGNPAVLHLPTLNVTADVHPVDSTHGVLQVPDDIATVGWWKNSAPAGSTAGSTVLDGHIDSAAAGEGALFHLADLSPGDLLTVTTTAGATITYQVQARRVYVKEQGLPANLFDQNVPGRLIIISCGGSFDPTIASYRDNIAIFATPTT